MDLPILISNFSNEVSLLVQELSENPAFKRIFTVVLYGALAIIANLFVDRLLKRLAGRTKMTTDDQIIGFLHRPICLSVFLFGLLHALYLPPALSTPWNVILPNLTQTLILLLWLVAVIKEINLMNEANMTGFFEKKLIDRDLFMLIKNISRVLILFAGIAWGLLIWDIDLTPLFASAGIAGIAIALAAKDTMANFFGGISLFADRAYKVGDYIILGSGERGEVVEMGIRSTKIQTRDDIMISIPNSILANSMIINESAPKPRFRIRIDVSVAYGSDLRKIEKTLLRVAEQNESLARKPEPRVRVRAFADSSINFQLLVWVQNPSEKGMQTHNLLKAIYKTFTNEGITIPFPQRDVHLVTARQEETQEILPKSDQPAS